MLDTASIRTDATDGLRGEWLELFGRARNATIYLHPDVAGRDGAWVYERRDGTRLCGLAVLAPRRLELGHVPGLRRWTSLDARRLVGGRVLGEDGPGEAEALLRTALDHIDEGAADCLLLEDVEVDSPLWQAAHRLGSRGRAFSFPWAPQPHWWIDVPDPPGAYWKSFSSKTRSTLRRKVRRLEHRLHRFRRPADVTEFVARASDVSRRSWQGRRLGLRVRDDDRTRERLRALAGRGALDGYLLEHDGRDLAFVLGVRDLDRFEYYEVGYDQGYADRSPGSVLLWRILEELFSGDAPPRLFDFGLGDGDYKRTFGRRRTESGPLVIVGRAPRPAALVALACVGRAADAAGRALIRRAGLYQAARRLYRRV